MDRKWRTEISKATSSFGSPMRHNILHKGFSAVSFVVILATLGIIGGGVYYLWTESSHPVAQQVSKQSVAAAETTLAAAPTTGEFRSTLPRLVKRGDTLECDWRVQSEIPGMSLGPGKLWTMGNHGRSWGAGTVNGMQMEVNALYKDETVYSWMKINGQSVSYTFTKSEMESMSDQMTPEQKTQAQQINQEMIYNCKAWNPDPTKFSLPTDVDFKTK